VERVAVIGPVAAGKTTLGRALAAVLDLPWIDLDDVYYADGATWTDETWAAHHRELVARDRWLVSGDYRAVAADRFARADLVVWLDPPTWWCAVRAVRRSRRGRLDCLRWLRRYPRHGRLETERALAVWPDLDVRRFTAARNVTVADVVS